ncbi:MAG: hypothetical protein UX44_C0028G0002 [candidate division WWE3 bacterium GW2011_GWA1_46_21]|uniref:Uncharacterized protein n=3 Tax=Katanobacteria TaxID=422282 RepID=A0A0G1PB46_UNCKA|nr:MAG: hypothetical protein UX44_C0028G0002 [candidate division WWE3 bacterium GW2011_GWA1_46_21]KKU50584.1 MAG: hypothetical protein UX73_C0020G0009 [candidate division WWE3 bacterium GW2011_GWC1_47_10]KKU56930.1 MAG: hypothetical protein UX79_C0026G0002 [candidate division WWE3 bacterium GW2011_GWB1_47_11]
MGLGGAQRCSLFQKENPLCAPPRPAQVTPSRKLPCCVRRPRERSSPRLCARYKRERFQRRRGTGNPSRLCRTLPAARSKRLLLASGDIWHTWFGSWSKSPLQIRLDLYNPKIAGSQYCHPLFVILSPPRRGEGSRFLAALGMTCRNYRSVVTFSLIGKVKYTFVPSPTLLSTRIVPPCKSTNFFVMKSPRPLPVPSITSGLFFTLKNLLKM